MEFTIDNGLTLTPIAALENHIANIKEFEKSKPEILAYIAKHEMDILKELNELEKNPQQNKAAITYRKDILCGLKDAAIKINEELPHLIAEEKKLESKLSTSELAFFRIKKNINQGLNFLTLVLSR